jgi:RNA polymerase sigma-70 factor (ECF subfamily)
MPGELDFERVVDQHHAALYRFALSLSRNESDASDLVQDTFYLWATKGHQLLDVRMVKAWLFTTLHREFLGRRRRWVRFPHHELTEVEDELPGVAPDQSGRADWQTVVECLGRVDEIFQAPVALFYLEDCSYNQIAEILEIPLGTVKSRIARGIAQLQQLLIQRVTANTSVKPKTP